MIAEGIAALCVLGGFVVGSLFTLWVIIKR